MQDTAEHERCENACYLSKIVRLSSALFFFALVLAWVPFGPPGSPALSLTADSAAFRGPLPDVRSDFLDAFTGAEGEARATAGFCKGVIFRLCFAEILAYLKKELCSQLQKSHIGGFFPASVSQFSGTNTNLLFLTAAELAASKQTKNISAADSPPEQHGRGIIFSYEK